MKRNFIIIVFLSFISGIIIFIQSANLNLPGVHQGFAPEQPIAFSHRVHSGDLQMDCLYCHSSAEKSAVAAIPTANICMNCHRFVTAAWDSIKAEETRSIEQSRDLQLVVSKELEKLYSAVGYNSQELKYSDDQKKNLIEWNRVYNLPDFVYFDHRNHVNAGVRCQRCHGPVETMEKIVQFPDLTMGWCVNCHRDVNNGKIAELKGRNASISCAACHY